MGDPTYLSFVRAHARFLAYGFLLNFAASFGQTYYFGVFGGVLRDAYRLSHADFGSLYSIATLASAATLVWLGRRIDDADLRRYSVAVCAGMAAACLLVGLGTSPLWLLAGMFALRLCGQGLMTHTAFTSMARYFDRERGRALAVSSLGQPLGQAVLPALAVAVVAVVGWRTTWLLSAGACALLLVPAVLWLLVGHGARHSRHEAALAAVEGDAWGKPPTRRQILTDPLFLLPVSVVLVPSFVSTGILFHQVHIALSKGWDPAVFATGQVAYALAATVSAMVAGPLVDRLGAARLLPGSLLPLAAAVAILMIADSAWAALAVLAFSGFTTGLTKVIMGAVWAEIYGVRHLGTIRALSSAGTVLFSALSPGILGWMFDAGVSVAALCVLFLVLCAGGSILGIAAARAHHRKKHS